jgi:hypothetical protein
MLQENAAQYNTWVDRNFKEFGYGLEIQTMP